MRCVPNKNHPIILITTYSFLETRETNSESASKSQGNSTFCKGKDTNQDIIDNSQIKQFISSN